MGLFRFRQQLYCADTVPADMPQQVKTAIADSAEAGLYSSANGVIIRQQVVEKYSTAVPVSGCCPSGSESDRGRLFSETSQDGA